MGKASTVAYSEHRTPRQKRLKGWANVHVHIVDFRRAM
jgi:hypothetical protein